MAEIVSITKICFFIILSPSVSDAQTVQLFFS